MATKQKATKPNQEQKNKAVTISVKELRRFISHAKNIKPNNIIPILAYVKMECRGNRATITKSSLNTFVVVDVEADFKGEHSFIIEEKSLIACVSFAEGEVMSIYKDGNNVVLDDGVSPFSVMEPQDHFPAVQEPETDGAELNADHVEALSIAAQHILPSGDKSLMGWMNFVHIRKVHQKSTVVGVGGPIVYLRSFKDDLPQMSIDSETVAIVAKMPNGTTYRSSEKYDFFQSVGILYGIIKYEVKVVDITPVYDKMKSDEYFIVDRKSIINFCEKVSSANSSSLPPEITIEDKGKNLLLKFSDMAQSQHAERVVEADKNFTIAEPICVQPKNVLIVLGALTAEKIKISKVPNNMIVSSEDEPGYLGAILELQRPS